MLTIINQKSDRRPIKFYKCDRAQLSSGYNSIDTV